MKNKTKILLSVINFALALLLCATSVFAWFSLSDNASDAEFKFARINSEVYFYTAQDFDFNGSPDLIQTTAPAYPEAEKHDGYYKETRMFDFVQKQEAYADGTGVVTDKVSIENYLTDVFPSQIYTIKLSVVNKGDSTNRLSIKFDEKSGLADKADLAYSTLAARVCVLKNADCDTSVEPTIEKGDWFYFCDAAQGNGNYNQITPFSNYDLFGLDELMKAENKGKAVNVIDVWLQIKMVPYDELQAMEAFAELDITEAQYQSLQKQSGVIDLSFSVMFEVDSEHVTA